MYDCKRIQEFLAHFRTQSFEAQARIGELQAQIGSLRAQLDALMEQEQRRQLVQNNLEVALDLLQPLPEYQVEDTLYLQVVQEELQSPDITVRRQAELKQARDRLKARIVDNCAHSVVLHYPGYKDYYGDGSRDETPEWLCGHCHLHEYTTPKKLGPKIAGRRTVEVRMETLAKYQGGALSPETLISADVKTLIQ